MFSQHTNSHAAQEGIMRESYLLTPELFIRFLYVADSLDHCLSAGEVVMVVPVAL